MGDESLAANEAINNLRIEIIRSELQQEQEVPVTLKQLGDLMEKT